MGVLRELPDGKVYVNGKEKVIDFDFEHLPDEDDFCKQINEKLDKEE